jgi:ketosteroid isomerase-like protein
MNRSVALRLSLSLLCSTVFFACCSTAIAQAAGCTELSIRDAVQKSTIQYTDDTFFWSGAFDKPLIGKAAGEEAFKSVAATRKHEMSAEKPDRIVVSGAGDMAYEYGTGALSFTDRKTGKRTSFQIGYLRVWRSVDGRCEVAASLFKPIESTIQTQ